MNNWEMPEVKFFRVRRICRRHHAHGRSTHYDLRDYGDGDSLRSWCARCIKDFRDRDEYYRLVMFHGMRVEAGVSPIQLARLLRGRRREFETKPRRSKGSPNSRVYPPLIMQEAQREWWGALCSNPSLRMWESLGIEERNAALGEAWPIRFQMKQYQVPPQVTALTDHLWASLFDAVMNDKPGPLFQYDGRHQPGGYALDDLEAPFRWASWVVDYVVWRDTWTFAQSTRSTAMAG